MSYFQNPFHEEFRGNWVLGDRQLSLVFACPPNTGRGSETVVSWKHENYDLSGNDADSNSKAYLTLVFAMGGLEFKNWAEVSVDVSGATASDTTAYEIVTKLNVDSQFSNYFIASVVKGNNKNYVSIKQKLPAIKLKFYVKNGGAEVALRFNERAGLAELPTYFIRHTVDESSRNVFPDAQNMLVYLNPTGWSSLGDNVAGDVIALATDSKGKSLNLDPTTIQEDWQLLRGRSGLFTFKKITVDVSDRITEIIEYQAGAVAGDFARKTLYCYSGDDTNPSSIAEIPYVLTDSDLITPGECGEET